MSKSKENTSGFIIYKNHKDGCWVTPQDEHGNIWTVPFGSFVIDLVGKLLSANSSEFFKQREHFSINNAPSSPFHPRPYAEMAGYTDAQGVLNEQKISDAQEREKQAFLLIKDDVESLYDFLLKLDRIKANGLEGQQDLHILFEDFKTLYYKYHCAVLAEGRKEYYDEYSENITYTDWLRSSILYNGNNVVFHDNKCIPLEVFELPGSNFYTLFPLDLFALFFESNAELKKCPNCGNLFFNSAGKIKYCNACRNSYQSIKQTIRKNDPCRSKHKAITDYINNTLQGDTTDFLNESNYYWDIVREKNPESNSKYRTDIKTREDYYNWLCAESERYKALNKEKKLYKKKKTP